MKTVSLNLSIEQLDELHVSLANRLIQLDKSINDKNLTISTIAKRQMKRVIPIYQQVEQLVVNHYSNV